MDRTELLSQLTCMVIFLMRIVGSCCCHFLILLNPKNFNGRMEMSHSATVWLINMFFQIFWTTVKLFGT